MKLRNLIDRAVGVVSPKAEARRIAARVASHHYRTQLRRFEGASKGRRTKGWVTSNGSADAENRFALPVLVQRCRDLTRNVPEAAAAVNVLEDGIVGTGIRPTASVPVPRNASQRRRRQADEEALQVQEAWTRWGETTECDADGRMDFYGLESTAARTAVESGECLVRRRFRRPSDGLYVPLQLQLLEPDHLDFTKNETTKGGGRIIQGVEFDAIGRRVAYWLYKEHPGSNMIAPGPMALESQRVPAAEILHVFRSDRIGQTRGIPAGAAAIVKLKDLADCKDAHLVRQKIAACFVGFVETMDPEDAGFSGVKPAGEDWTEDKFEPGMWQHLLPGESIKFGTPPAVEGFRDYIEIELAAVASAYGVSYESLTGDFSRVNFHSGRLGRIREHGNIKKWRMKALQPQLLGPVWAWFTSQAFVAGRVPTLEARATWTPPPVAMTDPAREIRSMRDEVRAGLSSLSEAIRSRGRDPRRVMEQIALDLKLLDELGITVEADARRPAAGAAGGGNQGGDRDLAELLEDTLGPGTGRRNRVGDLNGTHLPAEG